MHKVQKGKRQPSNNITSDYWFHHFRTVLENEIDTDEEDTFQNVFLIDIYLKKTC